jgi:hypothetical protein
MMAYNPNQCSDMANSGKSGGVNNQGGTVTAEEHYPASIAPASNIPPVGTSNGGK